MGAGNYFEKSRRYTYLGQNIGFMFLQKKHLYLIYAAYNKLASTSSTTCYATHSPDTDAPFTYFNIQNAVIFANI